MFCEFLITNDSFICSRKISYQSEFHMMKESLKVLEYNQTITVCTHGLYCHTNGKEQFGTLLVSLLNLHFLGLIDTAWNIFDFNDVF